MNAHNGIDQEQRTWAMVAHIGPILVSLVSGGLLCFVVPLVLYLAKQESSPFIAEHARESLNFRLTLLIAYIILWPVIVLLALSGIGLCIVIPMAALVWFVELVLSIVGGVKAMGGESYSYPFAWRIVS